MSKGSNFRIIASLFSKEVGTQHYSSILGDAIYQKKRPVQASPRRRRSWTSMRHHFNHLFPFKRMLVPEVNSFVSAGPLWRLIIKGLVCFLESHACFSSSRSCPCDSWQRPLIACCTARLKDLYLLSRAVYKSLDLRMNLLYIYYW